MMFLFLVLRFMQKLIKIQDENRCYEGGENGMETIRVEYQFYNDFQVWGHEKIDNIQFRRMLKKSIPAFVQKTWNLLESAQFRDVICWNEQGDAFRIVNDHQFQHTVLPIYFKHSNLTSFQRQLNMYNFHKRKLENGQTQYHHRLFRMHQRQLLSAIRRKPSEDQIEIGEELLRKLALDHQQTHHENQPQKEKIQAFPLSVPSKTAHQKQHYLPQQQVKHEDFVEKPISYDLQGLNYQQITYPFAYYYMPPPYHLPYVVGWCPQKKIKTHVLVQSPNEEEGIY